MRIRQFLPHQNLRIGFYLRQVVSWVVHLKAKSMQVCNLQIRVKLCIGKFIQYGQAKGQILILPPWLYVIFDSGMQSKAIRFSLQAKQSNSKQN